MNFAHVPGHAVFQDLNINIAAGTNVALCGARGGGKTTLAHLLVRLHQLDSRRIRIGGVDIREMPKATLRRCVGYVSSRPDFVAGTLRDNVASLDPVVSDEQITKLIGRVAGEDFLGRFPHGLDTRITFDASNISDGEILVLGLVRALVFDPEVLIIDGATDGLDSLTADQVQSGLDGILTDQTVIAITERVEVLQVVDEVLVINEEKVTARGTHGDLIDSNASYRQMVTNWIAV